MEYETDIWTFKQDDTIRKKWWWSRKSPHNGETVGKSSQGYSTRALCEENAVRNGKPPGPTHVHDDSWSIYKDAAKEWRWRRVATNEITVGAAHEGYVNKADCIANAERHGYPGE